MASEYTSHFNLDKYTNADKPNLRDQYNSAMDKIDNQMYANATNVVTSLNTANIAKAEADTAVANSETNAKAITDETTRATAAEKSNTDAITAETTRATTAEQANSDAVTAEETRAKAAEATNATDISAETTRAKAAEKANSDSIASETTRATAAEKANSDAVTTEETRAKAAEATNAANIVAETARAEAAETTIASNINKFADKTFIFLGDSITIGQSSLTPSYYSDPWPIVFGNLSKAKVTNAAIGGATASSASPATSNAYSQAQAINKSYDYVVMMFGTNDYGYAEQLFNTAKGLSNAITYVQNKYPDSIVIGVIPPYMPGDKTFNAAGFNAYDYKGTIEGVYKNFNVPVINFTKTMGYNATNWNSHIWDTSGPYLHPNEATHAYMGKIFFDAMQPNTFSDNSNIILPYTFLNSCQFLDDSGQPTNTYIKTPPIVTWHDNCLNVDFRNGMNVPNGVTTIMQVDLGTIPNVVNSFPGASYSLCALCNASFVPSMCVLGVGQDGKLSILSGRTADYTKLYGSVRFQL